MTGMEHLPPEIVCLIADMCTLGVYPKLGQYPSSYAKYHARLARTSRHFYTILNPALYKRNSLEDPPLDSCVLWAAGRGRLETLKTAHRLGASLDNNGSREWDDFGRGFGEIPGRMRFLAAPLHLAIQYGHRHVLEYLLENGAHVDVAARRFCTGNKVLQDNVQCPAFPYPLHTALVHEHGLEDAPAMLIRRGAYLVARGIHAFPIVADSGRADLVDLLLGLNEPSVTAAALRHAVEAQDFDLFQRMLARPELNAATADHLGQTALHFAAFLNDTAFATALLQRPETNAAAADNDLETPLHHAARFGNLPLVELLLQRPEVNAAAVNSSGRTPLHHAVQEESIAIVQRLLARPEVDAGAVTPISQTETPLQLAVCSGVPELVDLFLQREDVDVTAFDSHGRTLLHYISASFEDDTGAMVPLVGKLVNKGVPVNRLAEDGTALFYAVKSHNFRIALALLEHNADPAIMRNDPYGWTMLHHCLFFPGPKQTELVSKLISLGVETDTLTTPDESGGTPYDTSSCGSQLFFAAVYAESIACMKLLLDAGADADDVVIYTGSDQTVGDLNHGEEQSFLSGFFRHTLKTLPSFDAYVREIEDRVCLLLQYGASLDPCGRGGSPLEWACEAALKKGSFALLKLLLNNSTKANVSLHHIKDRIDNCYERALIDPAENEQVIEMLTQFMEREYPGAAAGGQKEDQDNEKDGGAR
ncbi:hypothetical protein QQZ08_005044 [Neonectria magnoliae]|uniref:Uncharacterized protein n=1 Tax=Neonectria magnoliae TaxID=2732573 RepID=A0ABR1I4M4_9HYPO